MPDSVYDGYNVDIETAERYEKAIAERKRALAIIGRVMPGDHQRCECPYVENMVFIFYEAYPRCLNCGDAVRKMRQASPAYRWAWIIELLFDKL